VGSQKLPGGEEYEVRLLDLPDDDPPPIVRLRQPLKAALRALGLKCLSACDVTPRPTRDAATSTPADSMNEILPSEE
jgi:hypothetical protein